MEQKIEELVLKTFLNNAYQKHNVARLQHLFSLGLNLSNKKVLEFGAGIGDHTYFYLTQNCDIYPTEGRKELVDIIKNRFGINAGVIDCEKDKKPIEKLENSDIIHCYGLLYHIKNPAEFLSWISSKSQILLLETCVSSDFDKVGPNLVEENKSIPTQAISGIGCRPHRKWLEAELKKWYKYVYYPKTQPKHEQFPIDWSVKDDGNKLLRRCVFICSQAPISNPNLTTQQPIVYEKW